MVENLSKNKLIGLKKSKKESKKLSGEIEELRNQVFFFIRNLEEKSISASAFYIELLGILHDVSEDLNYLTKIAEAHVDNNHRKLKLSQIRDLYEIRLAFKKLRKETLEAFREKNNINEIGSYYADWIMQDAPQEITKQSKEDIIIRTYFDPKIQKEVDETISSFLETQIMSDSKAQIAVVVMSSNGRLRAMSGGRPSEKIPGQFNRAFQAKRQPGSAFKPFVYGAALDLGISPNTIIIDEPVTIMFGKNNYKEYSPKNYDNRYLGPVTLEEAFSKSLNTVAVKVGNQIGINRVKTLANELGIELSLIHI